MNQDKHTAAKLAKVEMQKLWAEVDNLNTRIDYWRRVMDDNCQHESESVLSKYHEGGYDYVSTIAITHTCDLCGKLLKSYNDQHHRGTYA
jgi:hypothetical protein